MLSDFSTPDHRNRTLIFMALCGLCAIAAAVVGIDDNPPGILLAYLSAIAFVLAFVHPWRTAKPFMILSGASIFSLVLFVLLNNFFAAGAHDPTTPEGFQKLLQGLAVVAFFLGTLIFPAAFIIGVIGSVTMFTRNRKRPK